LTAALAMTRSDWRRNGNDTIRGGAGDDRLDGGKASIDLTVGLETTHTRDAMTGFRRRGNDTISGGDGNDTI
jgi:Ca2+-binding RTX toxin-like protein